MPTISLKLIVVIQWMLVIWASMWNNTYAWCNVTTLAIGIWAIADKQSVEAILLFLTTTFLSIIVDIVLLSLLFPEESKSGRLKFSAGMAIVNLILKPFVLLLLYQMYKDRGGEYNINFGQNNTTYDQLGAEEGTPQNHGSSAYVTPPIISKQ